MIAIIFLGGTPAAMLRALLLMLATSALAMHPNVNAHYHTRRALLSTFGASAAILTTSGAAEAYGIQARGPRDFSSLPENKDAVNAKIRIAAEAARVREEEATAQRALEASARFGAQLAPPANKAQEKLARARAEAEARAQRR